MKFEAGAARPCRQPLPGVVFVRRLEQWLFPVLDMQVHIPAVFIPVPCIPALAGRAIRRVIFRGTRMSVTEYDVLLCKSGDIPEGGCLGFDPDNHGQDSLFVVRHGGRLYGWRNACPHVDGAPMAWRKHAYMNASGSHLACHAHGALFQPDTGVCVQGPCLGQRLQSLQVKEHDDGRVTLAGFAPG
jgi:nitrite reductase/ring-hydroxylating ferredoxin subunit